MQKEALLEQRYSTGSMPLLTSNHSFMTCGGPEAVTSATILMKCGVKTSSVGGQEHNILKTNYDISYPINSLL